MSSARYQPIATDDKSERDYDDEDASPAALHARLRADPRFNQPTPSVWKRLALLAFLFLLLWLGIHLRSQSSQPKVVHAQRYSKDYKFRPAASPVITERLKDGRVKVRGAAPSFAAGGKPAKGGRR